MADILIRGMEMPTEEEISKFIIIRYDGEVWIGESDNLVEGGFVACYPTNPMRAVPLPEGHGKLVDLDALINKLQTLLDKREKDTTFSGNREAGVTWDDAIDCIKAAPIIIPAEGGGAK